MITGILLLRHTWWLLLPCTLLFFSYLAYRACLVAAANYGVSVTAAFDVYHLRLFDEMGVKRPADTVEARRLHRLVNDLMQEDEQASVRYVPAAYPAAPAESSPPEE
jgi:hypothetical protein